MDDGKHVRWLIMFVLPLTLLHIAQIRSGHLFLFKLISTRDRSCSAGMKGAQG